LDLIEEVSPRVSLAPTGAIRAPAMAPAMEEVDIVVVDTRAPAFIADPAMAAQVMVPATNLAATMAPVTAKNKPAKLSTKNNALMNKNKNVNKPTKP